MQHIKAIGFDLVNTLITLDYSILSTAVSSLVQSLEKSGFDFDRDVFKETYKTEAMRCFQKAHEDHIEIHNSEWIGRALNVLGFDVQYQDPRILKAVDAYFSEFFCAAALIPGTVDILKTLKRKYTLGMLSNFTHAPFVRELIKRKNLARFFDVILISGELGYRKPHPRVFQTLVEKFGKKASEIMYIGDDPTADVKGAERAGLIPVWTTIVQDQNLKSISVNFFSNAENPGEDVPRISQWQDFLPMIT